MKNWLILIFVVSLGLNHAGAASLTSFNAVIKERTLVQTKNSAPVLDSGDTWNPAPYWFQAYSTVKAGTVRGPTGKTYKLALFPDEGNYEFSGPAVKTAALLASGYPDGTYTLVDGGKVSLSDEVYPNAPQFTSVDGKSPVWNSRKQLVLTAAKSHVIAWTAFTTSTSKFTYKTGGAEFAQLVGNQDGVGLNKNAFGPGSEAAFTTLTIPAKTMTSGKTYTFAVDYLLASDLKLAVAKTHTYDLAIYDTATYVTIVAE